MNEENSPKEPWKRQRILKPQDIPLQEEVLELAHTYTNLVEQSLFIMAYLTAGRITEIVKRTFKVKNIYKRTPTINGVKGKVIKNLYGSPMIERSIKIHFKEKEIYPGILKKDIIFTNKDNKDIMIIRMQNRKNKEIIIKRVPIPISHEKKFVRLLKKYLDKLGDEDPLFPFQRGKAEKIINKADMNPHFLRDIRLTHMVTEYNFNSFQLTKFAGWASPSPANRYVRLGVRDLIANY